MRGKKKGLKTYGPGGLTPLRTAWPALARSSEPDLDSNPAQNLELDNPSFYQRWLGTNPQQLSEQYLGFVTAIPKKSITQL